MNYENLISIVIPVFNAQAYLEEALESVRRQTWTFRVITRIRGLYRKQEKMSVIASVACFCMWTVRAVWRRI